MAYDTEAAGGSRLRSAFDPSELDRVDRILLGACAAIWLAALGTGVAAVVALVDLARGHPESSGESATPWLLYTVIGISALVIIGAVPLLLRARRMALEDAQSPARSAVRTSQPQRHAAPRRPPRSYEFSARKQSRSIHGPATRRRGCRSRRPQTHP